LRCGPTAMCLIKLLFCHVSANSVESRFSASRGKLHSFCWGHIPQAPYDVVCQARSASPVGLGSMPTAQRILHTMEHLPRGRPRPLPPSTARLVASPTFPSLSHMKGIRSGWGPSSALALTKIGTPHVLRQDRRMTTLPTAGSQGGTPPLGPPQHGQDYIGRQ
jgi:hypothetical protein